MRALIPVFSAAEAQTKRAGRRKTTVCQLGGGGGGGGGGSRHELLKYTNYRHDT